MADCRRCDRDWDDHTLREMREHHPANDLTMPFEKTEGDLYIQGIPGELVSAVVARAGVVVIPGNGPTPILLLKFMRPNGLDTAVEVALPLRADAMVHAGKTIRQAANAAVAAARRT